MKITQLWPTALGLVLAAPIASATVLENDFEAETVGSFPASGFFDINAQGTRVVEDDTTATPFGAANQYFHLGGANLRVATAIPGGEINELIQIGFDLVEPSGVGSTSILFGLAANVTSLDLNENAAYAFTLNNGTLASSGNTAVESGSLPALSEDTAYRFEFTLNRTGATADYPDPTNPANPALSLDDGRLALWIQDLGTSNWSGPVILTTSQAAAPQEFMFRGFSTFDNQIYVDNLVVSDAGMWDGEGADGFWATAANWVGDTVPSAGDALVFGAGPDTLLTNDLAAGTSFSGLRYLPTAGDYFTDGAAITLTGPVVNDSPAAQILATPVTLGADLEVQVNDGDVFFDGVLSGGFGLEKTGPGTAALTNLNTYTGTTTVSEGVLQLGDGTFDGNVAGPIVNAAALALAPASDTDFGSAISGAGVLRVLGPARSRLTGTNSYTGETLIEDGVLGLDAGSSLPAGAALAFVGSAGQLEVDGTAVTLGSLRADGPVPGTSTGVGTGSLTVDGGDLPVGPGNDSSPGDAVALDFSGLAGFTYDNAAGIVSVGNQVGGGNGRTGTLTLSDASILTADFIRVQNVGSGTSNPCLGVLELGADTTLNTNEIEIAHSGRDSGTIRFRSGLASGTLTLRAADGTGRAAIDMGRRNSSFFSSHDVTIDLVSGGTVSSTLDALVSTLTVGDLGFGNNVTQNASFRMGGGTLDANSIQLGKMLNSGTGGVLNSTLSVDGGDVIAPVVAFGENSSTDGALNATLEMIAGSLTATTLAAGSDTGAGSSTRTLSLQGGALSNTPGEDFTVTGVTLEVPSGAMPALEVEAGRTATLGAGSAAQFGIDSGTGTSGTLVITGDLVVAGNVRLSLVDEAAEPGPLPVGTKLVLVDYTAGSLTGLFEDASAAVINDGDLIELGFNVFEVDYDDTLGGGSLAVTLTVDQSFSTATFVYDVGDRVGSGNALSTDGWSGDDLPNWVGQSQSGDIYARNTNDGDDRITRTNDAGFGYSIPSDATSVTLDITARTNNNLWEAVLVTGATNVLGVGYDDTVDKFYVVDGANRIDEGGTTFTSGDVLLTVRLVVDPVAQTADLIYDPEGAATVMIDDAPVTVDGPALAAADGLAMRADSRFTGVASYTLEVQTAAGGADPYDDWAESFSLDPQGDGAPGEDPDGDGVINRIEYALNDNPTSGAASGKVVGSVQDVGGDDVLTLTLPVRGSGTPFSGATEQVSDAVDGLVYRIQGSDDLVDWTSMVISEVTPALDAGLPPLDDGWEYRTFRTPGTVDADPMDFIRPVIEAAP